MEDDIVKITNAVYRLLDYFPQGDPLKNKAKEKALEILECSKQVFSAHTFSSIGKSWDETSPAPLGRGGDSQGWLSLKKYLSPEREKVAERLLDSIEILESYLMLAKHQGWLSDVNFLIVLKEYDKIKSRLSLRKIPTGSIEASKKPEPQLSGNLETTGETEEGASRIVQQKLNNEEAYSPRQERILKILKQTGGGQVSDIIKELPSVTKRTIRRDLDDLLKKGKIVRSGEWNQVSYRVK